MMLPRGATAIAALRSPLASHLRRVQTRGFSAAVPAAPSTASSSPVAGVPVAPLTAAPTSLTSSITLLTGASMPLVGLGTWRAATGEVGAAVMEALDQGYRHIDGAAVYQNEPEVGAAINQWLARTGEKREALFVTSKLWNTNHDPAHVEGALRNTLAQLNLAYLDLYLIHWPVCFLHSHDDKGQLELYPKTKKGATLFSPEDVPLERTWEALIECQRKGLIRSVGVSNYTSEQVHALAQRFGREGPAVNQVEAHPFCAQHNMQRSLSSAGVHLTAYSPLGNINAAPPSAGIKAARGAAPPPVSPLAHPTIVAIAARHSVTPAQVLLRWNLQLSRVVIPKSVRPERIRENSQLFHFQLTADDMSQIEQLNQPPTQHRFLNPSSFKRTPRKYFFTHFE